MPYRSSARMNAFLPCRHEDRGLPELHAPFLLEQAGVPLPFRRVSVELVEQRPLRPPRRLPGEDRVRREPRRPRATKAMPLPHTLLRILALAIIPLSPRPARAATANPRTRSPFHCSRGREPGARREQEPVSASPPASSS